MTYEYRKYVTNQSDLLVTLDKYGVAIIPAVLDNDEIDKMRSGAWDYLEHITSNFELPISRDNSATWRELRKLYPKHSMLIQQWGIGHAQYVWDIRQNPKIVNIFANIWGTKPDDLLVSFDGASIHMPPEKTNCGWLRKAKYHCDQSFTRNNFDCVQSWVTAYDVNDGDATLAFLENSHKYHSDFADKFQKTSKTDWYLLSPEEINYYTKRLGCSEKRIKCPAGSMVFWDSRTIHCGVEASKNRPSENLRNVVYVCMTPRIRATTALIKKKQQAFENKRTTNHYPHKPKLFPKIPRTYGGQIPNVKEIEPPVITSLGRKLIGYSMWKG